MSAASARRGAIRRRPARTVPATVVAIGLLLIGAGLVVLGGSRLAGAPVDSRTTAAIDRVARVHWNDPAVLALSVVIVVIGLVVLIAAVLPGRRAMLAVDLGQTDRAATQADRAVMSRRALRSLLISRVGAVDGVDKVDAEVNERRITVQAMTATRYTDDVQADVADAVRQTVSDAALSPKPRIRTTVRQRD